MRTKIVVDDDLVAEAMRRTGIRTKRAVVEEALRTLIGLMRQEGILRCAAISTGTAISTRCGATEPELGLDATAPASPPARAQSPTVSWTSRTKA